MARPVLFAAVMLTTSHVEPLSASSSSAAVVVLEHGAAWPRGFLDDAPPTALATYHQDERESHAELASRAARGVASMERRGVPITHAVLSLSGATDGDARSSRVDLAHRLLTALTRARTPARLLVLARDASAPALHEAMALLDALTSTLLGSSVSIALRFEPAS